MQISKSDWSRYIRQLSAINGQAASLMQKWLDRNGYDSIDNMISYAKILTAKYGEAAAALACEMFDAVAFAAGSGTPAAVPAEVYSSGYIANAVRDVLQAEPASVPSLVGRMVKQAGADTMLQNAKRYGAEYAWIPSGDACDYCTMLAAQGWKHASKSAVAGAHAEHIHKNCRCEYAIRFDERGGVAGYGP